MKAKRFWKQANVEAAGTGFAVLLDGRAVRTPSKMQLVVPTRDLAQAIGDEWNAVEEHINPDVMPVTRAANSALDKVIPNFDAVVDMLADYGGTDLLCYRATSPQALQDRQAHGWDPLLDWAKVDLDAPLIATTGVMPILQPQPSLDNLRKAVAEHSAFGLAGLHDMITLSGSLVIGLAVAKDRLSASEGWSLSRIDEVWQAEQWGQDDSAMAAAAIKQQAFYDAKRFLELSKG